MADPTNVSYAGIVAWTKVDAGPMVNTDSLINADKLDGMHYSDMESKWREYTDIYGGGVVHSGTSNFPGNGSAASIPLNPSMLNADYVVVITPAGSSGFVGEWCVSSKATSGFEVTNSGSGTDSFYWAVIKV